MMPRLRVILPYALPGALALICCWWFLSRKKDEPDKKQKHAVSQTVLHTDVFKELVPTDTSCLGDSFEACAASVEWQDGASVELQDGSAQVMGSLTQTHSLKEEARIASCSETLFSHCEIRAHLAETIDVAIPSFDMVMPVISQTNHIQPSNETYDLRPTETSTKVEAFNNCPSSQLHGVPSTESNVQPCMTEKEMVLVHCSSSPAILDVISNDLAKNELQTTDPVIDSLEEEIHKEFISNSDAKVFEQPSENGAVYTPSTLQSFHNDVNQIVTRNFIPTETSTEVEALKNILSAELHVKPSAEQSLQPCMDEIETVVKMSLLVQCPQAVDSETDVSAREDHCSCQSSECNLAAHSTSQPKESEYKANLCEITSNVLPTDDLTNSCVIDSTEILREGKCTDILDAFSQCLGKNEPFETTSSVENCLEEEKNSNAFFVNYEAKIVEQLAMNIISKVIVAAKQEILASSTSDMAGTCQLLDESSGKSLQKEAPSPQLALDKTDTDSCVASVVTEINSTCEPTQTGQSKLDDLSNAEVTDDSCLEQQNYNNEDILNKSAEPTHPLASLSQVHRNADILEESQVTMEDSSVSVCTSEDGISMDDPLQSTVLSSIGIGSYDSWSSSGIELSGGDVFSERLKTDGAVENGTGDVKKSTADCKNEVPWTEGEAYHSGGSDVNSMDSVDSGCALGNQKNEEKKDSFVVWEFEVPKHLVGRLIGKRGRFVSFLKESSGAKIYISTLPYTEDYQICHIEGSPQQVERTLYLIGSKFKELDLTNIYAPPPSVSLQSLLMTSWLMLPDGVTVEVIVVNVVNAGHMFVQQHTHPTFHALRSLDEQMSICYSQSGIPSLPTPVKVGVICVAPIGDNSWRRAQVVSYYSGSEEVEIRYVDYGGYEKVKIDTLRQIRSDFVPLPFQGAEVLLDNVIPLTGEDYFSTEADDATKEMTRGKALLAQVTNYDGATGLPLVHIWSMMGDEVLSINRTLVERGFAQWIDGY